MYLIKQHSSRIRKPESDPTQAYETRPEPGIFVSWACLFGF